MSTWITGALNLQSTVWSALFLGSTLLTSRDVPPLVEHLPLCGWIPAIQGVSVPGIVGVGVSIALGLRLWRAINKSRHLDRRNRR